MSLTEDVKEICDRLAPLGWRDLLLAATGDALDVKKSTSAELKVALIEPLESIDRSKRGFEDFSATGVRAITAGRPEQSLLYHALASPNIHPTLDGETLLSPDHYPTLEELDVIENFIYSLVADRTDLEDTVVAVFAYQYRVASRSAHNRYADIAYSRTGIARVGTAAANYDPSRRSFWPIPEGGGDDISVLPARYGAFLARRAKPGAAGTVQGSHDGETDEEFFFPVHKLFAGSECLVGQDLNVDFQEFHRSEKLRMIHRYPEQEGGIPAPPGFDLASPPFVRDSVNGGNMVSLQMSGSSVLVVPEPATTLVRTASQINSVSGSSQLVHFQVPPTRSIGRLNARGEIKFQSTRFTASTLKIPAEGNDRFAPEYVNIRHAIDPAGSVNQTPQNLNSLASSAFATAMRDGGHLAAHLVDDSCDGCVQAVVSGLRGGGEQRLAFSLVTAPDFFPLADQLEVETDPSIARVRPLSKGRLPANVTLPRPDDLTALAFDGKDKTVTAVVGGPASGPRISIVGHANRVVSFLPDGASDIFAPGWDTSRSRSDTFGAYLTSSGLGSPFPEDAKLCAALASFWPAVAPDNGRTFGNEGFGNQLPMLDEELGFHPDHDWVTANKVMSYRGWDGEYGPFFQDVGGRPHVNFVAIERSDYVSHALAGRIRVSLTANVQSEDLIARNDALEACQRIPAIRDLRRPCLVVFRAVESWRDIGPGRHGLTGGGFLLEFADLDEVRKATSEIDRVRRAAAEHHICQVASNGIAHKNNDAKFVFIPR